MANNVIDCSASTNAIVKSWQKAVTPDFAQSISNLSNPYGDGHAAERMCEFIVNNNDRARLLDKQALRLSDSDGTEEFIQSD